MSIMKTREPTSSEQATEALEARREAARARRREAAERAATVAGDEETVAARITRFGDGLVSSGEHLAGAGDLCWEAGETAMLPRAVAEALERRGLAEVQAEPAAAAPAKLKGAPAAGGDG